MPKLDGTNIYGELNVFGDAKLKRDLQLFGNLYVGGTQLTASIAEINKLDGFTGTYEDLNYAKDLRATGVTSTEFDALDGVTAVGKRIMQIATSNTLSFVTIVDDTSVVALQPYDFRNSIGATSIGEYLFTMGNTNAIRFLKINANNTVTPRSDTDFRTDIGLGNIANYPIATQIQAEDDTNASTYMTPQRTWNAINKVFDYDSGTGILIINVT